MQHPHPVRTSPKTISIMIEFKPDVLIIYDVLLYLLQTTDSCYSFITSGISHKNRFKRDVLKEFEITGKENIRYRELVRETSSLR